MNYNAPDKVDGSEFTPQEHNQAKEAINSKFDASNVITNPSAPPSNTTVWSSGAVQAILQNFLSTGITYKGELTGGEDLNDPSFANPGYWIGKKTGYNSAGNQSVPIEANGVLIVYGNENYATQQYIAFQNQSNLFIRNYNFTLQAWSPWIEYATKSWVTDNYAPSMNQGVPEITVGGDVFVNTFNSTDLKGRLSVLNQSSQILGVGTNIVIHFSKEYTGLNVIMLSPIIGDLKVSAYGSPDSTSATIRITEELIIGGIIDFFYLIQ
jgi:hypothetical protein